MTNTVIHTATSKPTNRQIGIFSFKEFGSLRKKELDWFESKSRSRIDALLPLYELSKKVAEDLKIPEDEALSRVKDIGSPENENLIFTYSQEVKEIQSNVYTDTDFNGDITTMMILSRCLPSALNASAEDLFNYYGIEYSIENGWTQDNTDSLPLAIIEAICEFTLKEKDAQFTVELDDPDAGKVADTDVTLGK